MAASTSIATRAAYWRSNWNIALLPSILGGITNASFRRIYEYACRLRKVEKAQGDMFANVACFEEEEFFALLEWVKARVPPAVAAKLLWRHLSKEMIKQTLSEGG
jgi:hypothetical protein